MSRSMYSYISKAWDRPRDTYVKDIQWTRLQRWRKEPAVVVIDHPTRIDRARSLGYKAKQGIITARVRVRRGGLRKSRFYRRRRTKRMGINKKTMGKSIQRIAEERAARKFPNLEVLNSYWVGEDGISKWYEIILIDPNHPVIKSDKNLNWICTPSNNRRVYRGKTSAGKKGRGLSKRGIGTEKMRPSIRSNDRKGK
ncbi:MAG: 50S ribosomal protein L15e [Candidatus Methanoliparum thermophilum]|uniref:Large ribosomal subunit protein eL15 n=1 Tax=Methanoliparum thermophilum TaxID=2491083 RepID=A0A520KQW6_METT2|nr:MAG: 50S ribosomal protein L15e [Candidatus Methanoliparum thermophilum]